MDGYLSLFWEFLSDVGTRNLFMIVISVLAGVYLLAKMWLAAKSADRNFNAMLNIYNKQVEESREFRKEARERDEASRKETRERDEASRKETRERDEAWKTRHDALAKEIHEKEAALRKEIHERDEAWKTRHDALAKEIHEKEAALRKDIHERDEAWKTRHDALVKEIHEKEAALKMEIHERDEAWKTRHDALIKEIHEKEVALKMEIDERIAAQREDSAVLKDVHALLKILVSERETSPDEAREAAVRRPMFGEARGNSPISEEEDGKPLPGGHSGNQANEPKQKNSSSGKLARRSTGTGRGGRLTAKRAG